MNADCNNILNKENSLILRGMAIIAIMLHNFLHNQNLGFSAENEMSFSEDRATHFFNLITLGQCNGYEIFSFLGWTGVAVFIFLTGYGTFRNTPSNSWNESCQYIKRQYIKLLILLLPAVVIFALGDLIQNQLFPNIFKRTIYLTMMANFAYPWVKCPPGVYWYFGLTFQFYVLYAFFGKYVNKTNLLLLSILTLAGLAVLCLADVPKVLSVYRHCFTGWFVVFAIGVWLSRGGDSALATKQFSILFLGLSLVLSSFLVLVMNRWMITWLFVPIVALMMFGSAGMIVLKSDVLSRLFKYVGRLSAAIFVCHPIIRFVINRYFLPHTDNMLIIVCIYVVSTFFFAVLYDMLYKKSLLIINRK